MCLSVCVCICEVWLSDLKDKIMMYSAVQNNKNDVITMVIAKKINDERTNEMKDIGRQRVGVYKSM